MPDIPKLLKFNFSSTRYDPLWIVFCAICKSFSVSFYFLQFVHALIINGIIFYYISKNTQYRFIALLLYFLLYYLYFNTEILRESFAVCIFLLSINFYYRKKWILYYIICVLAILMHTSAIICLFFPFFSKIKINKYLYILIIITLLLVNVIWTFLSVNFIQLNLLYAIQTKADSYLTHNAFVFNLNGIIMAIIRYILTPLILIFYSNKILFNKNIKEIPFIFLYIFIGGFVVYNSVIFSRFNNYLILPTIIFSSNLLASILLRKINQMKAITFTLLFILICFPPIYLMFSPDSRANAIFYQRYFPYKSILSEERIHDREMIYFSIGK